MLGGLSAFGPLTTDMYLPALPLITRQWHTSASMVQLTLTACLGGLGVGQLVAGPLSDVLGRRRPLMAGLWVYFVASLACAVAPSIGVLVGLRLLQGLSGAAGLVVAQAVVRDLYSGRELARYLSLLMVVIGIGPIVAPLVGAVILHFTSWRGVFFVLAGIGLLFLGGAAKAVPETLPPERRAAGSFRVTARTMQAILADRRFAAYAMVTGFTIASLFSYISGSSFLFQDIYGVSPQVFSLLFAVNGVGLLISSQLNARLVLAVGPRTLLVIGTVSISVAGVAFLVAIAIGGVGIAGVEAPLLLLVSSLGLIIPNATALALADYAHAAGTAAALIGFVQFAVGAAVAPLAGIGGTHDAVPMAVLVSGFGVAALGLVAMARHREATPVGAGPATR